MHRGSECLGVEEKNSEESCGGVRQEESRYTPEGKENQNCCPKEVGLKCKEEAKVARILQV